MRPPEPAKGSREAGLGQLPCGSGGKPLPEMRAQLTRNKKRPRQKTGATWSSDHPANCRPLTCPEPGCTAAGTQPPSSTVSLSFPLCLAEGAALTPGPGGTGMAGPGQCRATTQQVARASHRAQGCDAQPARAGLTAREETRPGTCPALQPG